MEWTWNVFKECSTCPIQVTHQMKSWKIDVLTYTVWLYLVLVCDLNRYWTSMIERIFMGFYPPSVTFFPNVSSYLSLKVKLKIIQQLAFTSNLSEICACTFSSLWEKHSVQVEYMMRWNTCWVALIFKKLNLGNTNTNLRKFHNTKYNFTLNKKLKPKFQVYFPIPNIMN